jgi:hypothetical protein
MQLMNLLLGNNRENDVDDDHLIDICVNKTLEQFSLANNFIIIGVISEN